MDGLLKVYISIEGLYITFLGCSKVIGWTNNDGHDKINDGLDKIYDGLDKINDGLDK